MITHRIKLVKTTRSIILLFFVIVFLEFFAFIFVNRIIGWFLMLGIFVMIIVFQSEIRKFFIYSYLEKPAKTVSNKELGFIGEVSDALKNISRKKQGAIFVFEKKVDLRNYIDFGTKIDAKVSSALIESISTLYSPLHDGAIVFLQDRIVAAGCILPLFRGPIVSRDIEIGTRHRAAIGFSKMSNAIVCVLSEETGKYSIVDKGDVRKNVTLKEIRKTLVEYYTENEQK